MITNNKNIPIFQIPHDLYTDSIIRHLDLRRPEYNRAVVQAYVGQSAYHDQSLFFKTRIIKGYAFEDEDNAKKIIDFLNNDIKDKFGDHVTPRKFFKMLRRNKAELNSFHIGLELDSSGNVLHITALQSAFIFPDKSKEYYYFIAPNADILKYNYLNQADVQIYAKNDQFVKKYKNLNRRKGSESGYFIIEHTELQTNSDYTPLLPYQSALNPIQTCSNVNAFENSFIENASQAKNLYFVPDAFAGMKTNDPNAQKGVAEELEDQLNNSRYYERNNKSIVQSVNPQEAQKIQVVNIPFSGMQNFAPTVSQSREEILLSHGLNTVLVGIPTSGGLSTTEQEGAYNIYLEEIAKPELDEMAEEMVNLFKIIDPNFNTGFSFQTSDYSKMKQLETEEKEADIEAKQLTNIEFYINKGTLKQLNNYLAKIGRDELSEREFNKLKEKSSTVFDKLMNTEKSPE